MQFRVESDEDSFSLMTLQMQRFFSKRSCTMAWCQTAIRGYCNRASNNASMKHNADDTRCPATWSHAAT